jgi:hypothetical protein
LKSCLGKLRLTEEQAKRLDVKAQTQMSPHLEKCCLRVSANVSYQRAAEDVAYLTGMVVPAKTQQRLVHRQDFEPPKVDVPVEEVSVDGGKVGSLNAIIRTTLYLARLQSDSH